MTYRERREARADRLREYASKREQRASAAAERSHQLADQIPFGQPILVGHHSEKRHRAHVAKIQNTMSAAVESGRMAESMARRAAEIDRQAEHAIYSDDPDAIERLTEKIAGLEAEREQMKAANAAFRKAHRDELKAMTAYQRSQAVPHPSYALQNLGGNISRSKARLAQLQREKTEGPRDRVIAARYGGECADCGAPIERGELIRFNRTDGARCAECPTTEAT